MYGMIPFNGGTGGMTGLIDGFPFDDFFSPFFREGRRPIRVDVRDEGDHYLMEADLPGKRREDVHVDVGGGVLTLSADTNEVHETKDEGRYVCRERTAGRSSRAFSLDGIREDGITAEFRDGVLKLYLPKEEQNPRKSRVVEIQ